MQSFSGANDRYASDDDKSDSLSPVSGVLGHEEYCARNRCIHWYQKHEELVVDLKIDASRVLPAKTARHYDVKAACKYSARNARSKEIRTV